MEKAEPLSFVKPFEPQYEASVDSEQNQETSELFTIVWDSILVKYKSYARAIEHPTDIGVITTFEVPLVIPLGDGSCVQVLVFGQRQNNKILNRGISVEEYSAHQMHTGGYMYSWDDAGLVRESNVAQPECTPYSIIEQLIDMSDLDMNLQSDDSEVRNEAKIEESLHIERDLLADYESELGYDGQLPSAEEVCQLADFLIGATPRV